MKQSNKKKAPMVKEVEQIEALLNPVGMSVVNELKFVGGQVRLGKSQYFS
jgi:hypothetical protein